VVYGDLYVSCIAPLLLWVGDAQSGTHAAIPVQMPIGPTLPNGIKPAMARLAYAFVFEQVVIVHKPRVGPRCIDARDDHAWLRVRRFHRDGVS